MRTHAPSEPRAPEHVARLVANGHVRRNAPVSTPVEPGSAFDPRACVGGVLFFAIMGGSCYVAAWLAAKAVELVAG